MEHLQNDALLEKIIAYAKSLGSSVHGIITAERYVVSVLDVILGVADFAPEEEEKKALSALIAKHFALNEDFGFSDVKKLFVQHIEEETASPVNMESLYMQQRMLHAKEEARQKGFEKLTSDFLLECIFNAPSDFIKEYLAGSREDAPKTLDPESQKALWDVIKTMERTAEKKTTETTEPATEPAPAPVKQAEVSENPKEKVAALTAKVKMVNEKLLDCVYGQSNAIRVFTAGYFQAELLAMTDPTRTRPGATFLFAGPPGVGKTFLAEKAAEALGLPFQRFDMSEYADYQSHIELCGFGKNYQTPQPGTLTGFVDTNPKCVLLFDEIEKANPNVIQLFLQLLDAGRLRDNYTGREVAFKETILFFTTNAGKQLYEAADARDFSGTTRKVILNALQNDVNPRTGVPYFPAAICSRFASGNVVMFNHMTAHYLREIARREVLRHAENFETTYDIHVDIDEQVFTALLFAEGGTADARMIRSRAESFFDDELYELFRLLASDQSESSITDLESISIRVQLPAENEQLMALFCETGTQTVLVFSEEAVAAQCAGQCSGVGFSDAQDLDAAKKILNERDVSFVLVDLNFGQTKAKNFLNIEDVDSAARDFLWYIRENHADVPVYLLQYPEKCLNTEEQLSFLRQGVRGILTLDGQQNGFGAALEEITRQIHQQRSMINLARANKLVRFETAQSICDDGKNAEILLFDFGMTVAIDAEDSQSILSSVSKPDVRFDQIIGAQDAKKELRYFVEYLKNPKRYLGTGVQAPKGVLLYGPPGTGKTMMAKAMASESDVTFLSAEGNQFLKKYVGEGPEKVHELFCTARKYAPAILFIDEIDAIAKNRAGEEQTPGMDATLTALLTEMDGFKNDPARPVFVLAATNFDVDPGKQGSLDPALMRRFDRRIYIELPNREERVRYLRMRFAENPAFVLSEEEIESIAIRSTGMSLAALASVIELSLRTAIRDGELKVTDEIFDEAFETFNSGDTKHWDASQLERVARHEAGHAFLCWQSGEVPSYMTIVARGSHGGYMQHDDNEGKAIYTRDELLAQIRTSLGGRAAEIVYYGDENGISTGASGDLVSATRTARHIICTYGMDEDFGLAVIEPRAAETGELSGAVREAVNRILAEEMEHAIALIREHKPAIDALVEQLLLKNHLTGSEIREAIESITKKCGEPV